MPIVPLAVLPTMPTLDPHALIPLSSPVFYKTLGNTKAGVVISIPKSNVHLFYTVMDPTSQNLMGVPPNNASIWPNLVPMPVPSNAPTIMVSNPCNSDNKEKRTKQGKLGLNNLPHNQESCMSFHDSTRIQLAHFEWDTRSG
jgi:hypothetical protein